MRKGMSVSEFVQAVEARKRAAGVGDEAFVAARNSGRRRTAAKRQQLARIQERARSAGLEPLPANF